MCLQNERVYSLLVSSENECVYSFHVYLSSTRARNVISPSLSNRTKKNLDAPIAKVWRDSFISVT